MAKEKEEVKLSEREKQFFKERDEIAASIKKEG